MTWNMRLCITKRMVYEWKHLCLACVFNYVLPFILILIQVDKQGLDQQFFDKKQSDDYENRRDKAFGKFFYLL